MSETKTAELVAQETYAIWRGNHRKPLAKIPPHWYDLDRSQKELMAFFVLHLAEIADFGLFPIMIDDALRPSHPPSKARDKATLEHQIMDAGIAKNDAEWWAMQEIERLRSIERCAVALVQNIRENGMHDNWKQLAAELKE